MKPQDPHFEKKIKELFSKANFISELGVQLKSISPGQCKTTLQVQPRHMQQNKFVHAGVQATMADHTAGAAAGSLIKADEIILTVEFKINFLRPALGESLRCQSDVLKAGKNIYVAESEVFSISKGEEKLTAKSMITLSVVKWQNC
ncbi:PaaI family thioesterase [Candidatus Uabimicrobium sp. HlEnr_7]|uniref:PaaI family thioesterase n=1 Tax=Candidatus Uabimicrobium helgolandensis TaxID=3095367 RepID=UPI0035571466